MHLHVTHMEDTPEVRRVLAPSLVDRACSPMPDLALQQLRLPDILTAVRQQLLEPWAAQQQRDTMGQLLALPVNETEAGSEADESFNASQREASGVQSSVHEQEIRSLKQSPDITQLQMLDDMQLQQMHSTADLAAAASEAEQEAELAAETLPAQAASQASPSRLSAPMDTLYSKPDNSVPQGLEAARQQAASAAAAEQEEAEAAVLMLPSEVTAAAADMATSDRASSADSNDRLCQPEWHLQWDHMSKQQQQRQQRHNLQNRSGRGYRPQPSDLMKQVAAASLAEQSEPISAIFECHSQQAEPQTAGDKLRAATGNSPAAVNHDLHSDARLYSPHAAASPHGKDDVAADAAILLSHDMQASVSTTISAQPPLAAAEHAQQQDQAWQTQQTDNAHQAKQAQHIMTDQHESSWQVEASPGTSVTSKRSLVAAAKSSAKLPAKSAAHGSSAETSPEAARNSRMKVRRTSGEYQQVRVHTVTVQQLCLYMA